MICKNYLKLLEEMEHEDPKSEPQINPSHWQKLSPRRLEHRVYLPTAITFHRLAPETYRTLRNHRKLVPHPYKHLDPEEIVRAQAKARHALLKAKLIKDGAVDPVTSALHDYDKDKYQEYSGSSETGKKHVNSGSSETDEKRVENPVQPKGSVKIQNRIDNAKTTKNAPKSQGQVKTTKKDKIESEGQGKTTRNDSKSQGESEGQGKTTRNDSKSQGQISTRPKLPIYRGIGENNLRIRQITRHVAMIMESLQDLNNAPKVPDAKREFVSPSEIEVKKKRWNEFLHSSRRILFTLRREVNLIERTLKSEQKCDKFFRMLALSTLTLHKLLLAVKTYLEAALQSPQGKKFYNELIVVCHRMLKIASFLGIHPPKLKWKASAKMIEREKEEGSSDSSELISDRSANVLHVLQPEYVRNKLIQIANERLPKKEGNKVTFSEDQVRSEVFGEDQRPCSANGGSVSSKANKSRTSRHTCPEEGTVHESVSPPHPPLVCKMEDEDHLIEKTASEVINRLIPLIDHSHKEKHKEELDSETQSSSHSEKDSSFIKDIDHQIQFMLERLCRIEEELKHSVNIITEVSRRTDKKALCQDDSLQAAINQAQNVLDNLTQTKTYATRLDTLSVAPRNLRNFAENKLMDVNVASEETSAKGRTIIDEKVSMEGDSENSVFANGLFPAPYHENINDQINRQKEEFWASLVQQGVMKPFGISVGATKNANETVDLILQQAVRDFVTGEDPSEKRSDVVGERITMKMPSSSTNVKLASTLGKANKQDKATLVTSLLSSYSDSFVTESTEQSTSSPNVMDNSESQERTEDNRSSGQSTNKSNDVLSSHMGMNDSESTSFPSYGNVSISEKNQVEL